MQNTTLLPKGRPARAVAALALVLMMAVSATGPADAKLPLDTEKIRPCSGPVMNDSFGRTYDHNGHCKMRSR